MIGTLDSNLGSVFTSLLGSGIPGDSKADSIDKSDVPKQSGYNTDNKNLLTQISVLNFLNPQIFTDFKNRLMLWFVKSPFPWLQNLWHNV